MKERLQHELEREFKPEFLGRLDEIVVFRSLNEEHLKQIVEIELSKVRERLAEKGLALVLTDEAKQFVVSKGNATEYGARPLRRAVETYIEDPLSENLLQGAFEGHNTITVRAKEVGDQKQLDFEPSTVEPIIEELAVVGAEVAAT